ANLDKKQRSELASYRFNAMTCVAALGFGDIPTQAFAAAYNLIRPQGWIAFNIKEDFLSGKDTSGFSRFIKTITDRDILSIRARRRYRHRLATNGTPLFYIAMVGIKERDIDTDLLV
ncbi:MAG: methyltransferase, partial [Phycisphaerae bacterium]